MAVKLGRYAFRRIGGRIIPIRIGAEGKTNVSNFAMSALRKLQGKKNLEAAKKVAEFTKDSVVKEKLFHGTESVFTKFRYDKIGTKTGTAGAGRGFYFTDKKQNAAAYGKKIKEAYLNIKKPLRGSLNDGFESNSIKKSSLTSILKGGDLSNFGEGVSAKSAASLLKKHNTNDVDLINDAGVSAFGSNFKKLYSRLKKFTGIDGVVQGNTKTTHYIAFNPDQIMLAPKRSKLYKNAIKKNKLLPKKYWTKK